jgi:hypothetical protein
VVSSAAARKKNARRRERAGETVLDKLRGPAEAARETKIFDPADGYGSLSDPIAVTDSTVVKRGKRWWMYLAGKLKGPGATHLFSASLPDGAPLSASGWNLTPEAKDSSRIALLGTQDASAAWDLAGGRHCPSYVKGWDPGKSAWVERIYYAGAATHIAGPYTIGYLEWNGSEWIDQPAPAFMADEEWEHGSVYEPNLVYADGKWKLWYVAGSNQEDYILHGFAESEDGRTGWTKHKVFVPPEEKMFDFCVLARPDGYEAVFSRVWLAQGPRPARTGLWWCRSNAPSPDVADWSKPIQIMTAEDRGWHTGPWKPSLQYGEADPNRMFVFFDGTYRTGGPGPFRLAFTLGCRELPRPE